MWLIVITGPVDANDERVSQTISGLCAPSPTHHNQRERFKMLISTDLRKKLTVLAIGSSLLAGCSSGPEMRFTRFWPSGDKTQSASDDEALAEKWRERLAASEASLEKPKENDVFAVAKAEQEAEESRSSRFNIFRRFSRKNKEEEIVEAAPEASPEAQRQRLLLERRIAELEAEQRALSDSRSAERRNTLIPSTRSNELNDPFLAASQQVKPDSAPSSSGETNLPDWAQLDQGTASAPQAPVKEVASEDLSNQFAPGFEDTLRELQASASQDIEEDTEELQEEMEEQAELASRRAPAMPFNSTISANPVAETRVVRNPFAEMEEAKPEIKPAPQTVVSTEPKLDTPIAEAGSSHPLAGSQSAAEQQEAWAHLEVQQLMKRSRIQARAGQYQDALATAVSAEQLSNNANIEFGLREQTPAQLISLIKMKSAETASIAKTTQPQVPSGCANLNLQPAPATNVAARPAIDTESPLPQWPGRDSVTQPQQVAENLAPAVTTPRASTPSIDKQFKTAEFLNPRPSQVKSPGTTSGTRDWNSMSQEPRSQGGFMEVTRSPRQSNANVQTRLISSSHIYSPENLQWTKLDASLATIRENDPAPLPTPIDNPAERPVFAEESNDEIAAAEDLFAGFEDAEIMETTLESTAPLSESAPAAPDEKGASNDAAGMTVMGIPLHKLALVGLAGLILLAAIYHRRRTFMIHDV